MSGDRVIIFGGSSGIGEATARAFSVDSRVTIVGRDRERCAAAASRVGGAVDHASVDGVDRVAVDAFFERTGSFEHLVLCLSGGKGAGAFRELSLDDLRSGFEAKLFAQLNVAQAALPKLESGGSITFVSAASARSTMRGTSGLAAINAAVEAMIRVLAIEVAPVRVNAVSPGVIDTPWWNQVPADAKEGFFARAAASLPVRRVGKPEDVASIIVAVAKNPFVTGSVFEVDGGARLIGP